MRTQTDFERFISNKVNKQKQEEDQKLLDEMCEQLKKQHEEQQQEKIRIAREVLKNLMQGA